MQWTREPLWLLIPGLPGPNRRNRLGGRGRFGLSAMSEPFLLAVHPGTPGAKHPKPARQRGLPPSRFPKTGAGPKRYRTDFERNVFQNWKGLESWFFRGRASSLTDRHAKSAFAGPPAGSISARRAPAHRGLESTRSGAGGGPEPRNTRKRDRDGPSDTGDFRKGLAPRRGREQARAPSLRRSARGLLRSERVFSKPA